ncbi:DUF6427 family protein [Apibacter raozihei]|uniref:DUF6427 family protein n=1 Tax=Apibacter TaxID=1778601 RepID=UPI000FE368A3|nr:MULTISPECIES: DUF6427 family protein [Apibacter]
MHSNTPFKKYFFAVLGLWVIFSGIFVYFFKPEQEETGKIVKVLALSSLSFILNIVTILNSKFKKKRKIWALAIYGLLFISSFQEFFNYNIGITYVLLSLALLLFLDVFSIPSSLKYFNIGMLVTISSFLYFPVAIIVLLFLFMTVVYYEEKINISQYLAGVLVTAILIFEIAYLSDHLNYIQEWVGNLSIPEFHFEYQIPILIILIIILIYGWINQYSNPNISDDIQISSQHTILVFYLLFWILIYAFFMGGNYELLIFISLPVSLIISRSM